MTEQNLSIPTSVDDALGWYLDAQWLEIARRMNTLPTWAQRFIRAVAEAELGRLCDDIATLPIDFHVMVDERQWFLLATDRER